MTSVVDKLTYNGGAKEIRFVIEMKNDKYFDKLRDRRYPNYRIDYYFPNFRIRKQMYGDRQGWLRVDEDWNGQAVKKKIPLDEKNIDIIKMEHTCDFKIYVRSKDPIVNGVELYLERVTVYKNEKPVNKFYTTEMEFSNEEEFNHAKRKLTLLEKMDGVKKLIYIGEKPLNEIVRERYL